MSTAPSMLAEVANSMRLQNGPTLLFKNPDAARVKKLESTKGHPPHFCPFCPGQLASALAVSELRGGKRGATELNLNRRVLGGNYP